MVFRCELHPVYGPVHRDGDLVRKGDVIGLSTDGDAAISSPCEGTIRIRRSEAFPYGVYAEILPIEATEKEAGIEPAPPRSLQ